MATSTVQYIDWDAEFKAAYRIAENAPGSSMTTDTGDLYEASAPCGCWVSSCCSHPSSVGLCAKHATEMPATESKQSRDDASLNMACEWAVSDMDLSIRFNSWGFTASEKQAKAHAKGWAWEAYLIAQRG